MATKMEILRDKLAQAEATAFALAQQIDGLENTPCGLSCSCGVSFETEADFAEHFVLPMSSIVNGWLNLAECPNSEKGKAILKHTAVFTAGII